MNRKRQFAIVLGLVILFVAVAASQASDSIERYLRIRHAFSPTFSPDASEVAFLTNSTGNYQVWKTSSAGGWPMQLSFGEERVHGVVWSPTDPQTLIYAMDAGGNERSQLYLLKADGSQVTDLTGDPKHIYNLGAFSRDGKYFAYTSNKCNGKDFDVYLLNMQTKDSRLVFQKGGYCQVEAFSPDGRYLTVGQWPSNFDTDLYLVDLKKNSSFLVTSQKSWARAMDVNWLPDSSGFYFLTDAGQEYMGLSLYRLKDRHPRSLDESKWNTEDIALSEDGRVMAMAVNENGYTKVQVYNPETGEKYPTPEFPGGRVYGMRMSKDGQAMLFVYSDPAHNFNVWQMDLASGDLSQLTHASLGGVPQKSFVRPKLVHYESFDGQKVPAFYYRPKNVKSGASTPVIVYMHGGPESQERPDFGWSFQYFLSRGYSVFAPNVRGSSGYGKKYLHADDRTKRMDSVKDMIHGVRWLKKQRGVNADAICVYGGSYGGYMVLAGLTEYPDEFAAGVSIVGIANFVTFLEKTGDYRRKLREAEYGYLDRDREFLKKISPVHKAKKITAPLMLIQGANDPRVPQGEADQMAEAIRKRGGVVEYLLYKDEGHGLSKLKNKLDAYPKMARFLDKVLKSSTEEK